MAENINEKYTREELVNMKLFTIQECKVYVKEKTGMGSSLFDECIRPRLRFRPFIKNLKRKRPSHLVVPKPEVDKLIARKKKELLNK